jgi:hypothetical protein
MTNPSLAIWTETYRDMCYMRETCISDREDFCGKEDSSCKVYIQATPYNSLVVYGAKTATRYCQWQLTIFGTESFIVSRTQ